MRSPSRDSSIRIAKSRRPSAVRRSQLSSSRVTLEASSALTSDASRHFATDGGDLIGKTRQQLRSVHFSRDRDWLQS
jgi:hypothetical protein